MDESIGSIHRKDTVPVKNVEKHSIRSDRCRSAFQPLKLSPEMDETSFSVDVMREQPDQVVGLPPPRVQDVRSSSLDFGGSINSPNGMLLSAIPIEDDSERDFQSIEKQKDHLLLTPAAASFYFSDVKCYATPRHQALGHVVPGPPPISPSDTYTTISMSHSMEFLLDADDEDEEELVLGRTASTVSTELVSHCFRRSTSDGESVEKTPEPSYPEEDSNDPHRFLLRMKPQNYLHDDEDDDYTDGYMYHSMQWDHYSAFPSKTLVRMNDPENLPPQMPELR
jgi:hypothetical protein